MRITSAFLQLNCLLSGVCLILTVHFSSAQSEKFHLYDSLFNETISFDQDKAASYLKKQRNYCTLKWEKADYWLNSMMLNYRRNAFDAALNDGRKAEKFIEKGNDRRSGSHVKLLSLIKWKQGDFEGANRLLFDKLEGESMKSVIVRAHLYNLIINNYLSLEKYDSALVMARTNHRELTLSNSLKENKTKGFRNLYQTNLLSIGNIYYYTAVYDSSLFYYQQAYAFDSSDPVWSVNCLMGIADVPTLKGDYEKSGKCYVEIIENLESRTEGYLLAHAYFNYATNFKEQGLVDEARVYFRKSESLSKRLNYDLILGLSFQEIGEDFFNNKKLDSAQFYVEKSIPILKKIQNARGLCLAHCHLSRIQSNRGNQKKSFHSANVAKEWMEKVNPLEARGEVWTTFYEYYERYGPVDSAFYYLKIAHSVNDSVKGLEVQKNLNNLEVTFETHLKEKENQLLRAEVLTKNTQVKQKEGERRFWQILMFLLFLLLVLVIVIGTSILKIRRQKLEVKEKKLAHSEQIKKLLLRKLDDADQAVLNAEQAISDLKNQQSSNQAVDSKQGPELLIESMRNEKDWVVFMVEFELIYTRFFSELKKVSSNDFTSGERRLLALIKLGLTNQEIADHIFISADSVKKSKNRLFKKIDLSDSKLRATDFIRNLE